MLLNHHRQRVEASCPAFMFEPGFCIPRLEGRGRLLNHRRQRVEARCPASMFGLGFCIPRLEGGGGFKSPPSGCQFRLTLIDSSLESSRNI